MHIYAEIYIYIYCGSPKLCSFENSEMLSCLAINICVCIYIYTCVYVFICGKFNCEHNISLRYYSSYIFIDRNVCDAR